MSKFSNNDSSGKVHQDFSSEEKDAIQRCLRLNLGPEYISYRQAAGGTRVAYIEGWRALEIANETFGFSGWSSCIRDLSVDFLDQKDGRFSCGVSAVVRIELKNGTFHEDVGYGTGENQKSKSAALEKAKKEAVTDAMKRTLRMFGNSLGNCIYDKEYLTYAKKFPTKKREYKPEDILREGDIAIKKAAITTESSSSRPVAANRLQETFQQMTRPAPKAGDIKTEVSNEESSPDEAQKVPPDLKTEQEEEFGDLDLLLENEEPTAGTEPTINVKKEIVQYSQQSQSQNQNQNQNQNQSGPRPMKTYQPALNKPTYQPQNFSNGNRVQPINGKPFSSPPRNGFQNQPFQNQNQNQNPSQNQNQTQNHTPNQTLPVVPNN